MFLDALLREVLDLVDFVGVAWVVFEGSIEQSSACTNSGYVSFFQDVLRSGSVFVSDVESWLNLIDFWVFLSSGIFVLPHDLCLFS